MAILFSTQSGNFTDASTWDVVNSASFMDSRTTLQSLSSTQTNATTAFTPGAITTSGVILQMGGRITSPSGTLTVRLFNNTTSAIVKDVVVNVTDLPSTGAVGTGYIGWTYFKFDSDVTLIAGNQYSIRAFTSVTTQISVYRDATTSNWSRGLVTTTTQAPATTDVLIVGGTFNSAGVNSPVTVTMNNTNMGITFGNLYVGSSGSLIYGNSPGVNYGLKFAGNFFIGMSGTFSIGTEASPIPISSTARLEMTCTSVGQYNLFSYGTFITQGATRNIRSKLNADVSIGSTSSTTSDSTGWLSGDVIVVPSTTRITSEFETVTLTGDASGASINHTGYTYAHGGNSVTLVQADLALLSRNVKIYNTNTATRGWITFANASTAIMRYTEFYDWGYTATQSTAANYGVGFFHSTSGTSIFEYNSVYQTSRLSYNAFYLVWSSAIINGNVFYALSTFASTGVSSINGSFQDDNIFIANGGFAAVSGTIKNRNVIASSANHGAQGAIFSGDVYDNNIYSNGSLALYFQTISSLNGFRCYNLKSWRNNVGISLVGTNGGNAIRSTIYLFENCYCFGNAGHLSFQSMTAKIVFNNSYFWGGDAAYRTQYGFYTVISTSNAQTPLFDSIFFNSCKFGIDYLGNENLFAVSCLIGAPGTNALFNSCKFAGVENQNFIAYGVMPTYSSVGFVSINHNEIVGEYRIFGRTFNAIGDSTYSYSSPKSLRLIPATSTYKGFTPNVRIPVKAGTTCTLSVRVRESANIVDTEYNGASPRLIWVYNPLAGNLSETVCDSIPNYNIIPSPPERLNTGWTISPASTTVGSPGNSPIGLANAYKVVIANGVNFAYTGSGTQTGIVTTSMPEFTGTRNLSFYVKPAGLNIARVMIGAATTLSSSKYVTVNLDTGEIINSAGGDNYLVESVGDGWYRISLDITSVSSTNNRFAVSLNDTTLTAGDGTKGVYIWGAQLTEGSGVQPYIPFGSWEELSYTTPVIPYDTLLDFYVDFDGTAGFINVDGWKSTGTNSRTNEFWLNNGPYIEADWTNPGSISTFIT